MAEFMLNESYWKYRNRLSLAKISFAYLENLQAVFVPLLEQFVTTYLIFQSFLWDPQLVKMHLMKVS